MSLELELQLRLLTTVIHEWYLTICHDLCLPPPRHVQIVPELPSVYGGMGGSYDPGSDTITLVPMTRHLPSGKQYVVDPAADSEKYLFLLCHELRHVWQHRHLQPPTEKDCNDYAADFRGRVPVPNCDPWYGPIFHPGFSECTRASCMEIIPNGWTLCEACRREEAEIMEDVGRVDVTDMLRDLESAKKGRRGTGGHS